MVPTYIEFDNIFIQCSVFLDITFNVGTSMGWTSAHVAAIFTINLFDLFLILFIYFQLLLAIHFLQVLVVPLDLEHLIFEIRMIVIRSLVSAIHRRIVMDSHLGHRDIDIFTFDSEIVIDFAKETELKLA